MVIYSTDQDHRNQLINWSNVTKMWW